MKLNEKGAALLYVLMISMLLILIVPSVLYLGSNSELQIIRSEKEKIVNQLTITGMQAIARHPGNVLDKLQFLEDHYGETEFTLPNGLVVTYRQYAVVSGTGTEWENREALDLVNYADYDVVVYASVGGVEKLLSTRFNVGEYSPKVEGVTILGTDEQFVNEAPDPPLAIVVETSNIPDNEVITVSLSDGTETVSNTCIIFGDFCNVEFDNLADLPASIYYIQTFYDGAEYPHLGPSLQYTIKPLIESITNVSVISTTDVYNIKVTIEISDALSSTDRTISIELRDPDDDLIVHYSLANAGTMPSSGTSVVLPIAIPASVPIDSYRIYVSINNDGNPITDNSYIYSMTELSSAVYPETHEEGAFQVIAVTVNASGYADGTEVQAEFIHDTGASYSTPIVGTGTIDNFTSSIPLVIPTTVPDGAYKIKVSILGNEDSSTTYAIYAAGSTPPPGAVEGEAMTFVNGVEETYTIQELEATGSITTTGMLFIPESYGDIQLSNNVPVVYTAPEGIFIGADIHTQAAGGNITLKSCNGPIQIDGAIFETGTGQTDISMSAGTYISAQGSTFSARNIYLTANEYIDISSATLNIQGSGGIVLSAYNNTTSIIATSTVFGTTPSQLANNGNGVSCP